MPVTPITELMRLTRSGLCVLLAEAEPTPRSPTSLESEQTKVRTIVAAIRCAPPRRSPALMRGQTHAPRLYGRRHRPDQTLLLLHKPMEIVHNVTRW